MSLDAIYKFVPLSEQLATAGQPTEAQLGAVRAQGFEVVVNLGLLDPRYCLPDEAGTVTALGMTYHHIPVNFQEPTADDFARFQHAMRACRDRRVFVHCAANMRVSCFVALYGETDLGWSREEADAHIKKQWEPNEVWSAFILKIRAGEKNALQW